MAKRHNIISKTEAQDLYRQTAPGPNDAPKTSVEAALHSDGYAAVNLGLAPDTFEQLSDKYAVCIGEMGEYLALTSGSFDAEGVPEDGHVRKEIGFNFAGMQTSDPKSLFHFNNTLAQKVVETGMLRGAPAEFRQFMEHGLDLHQALAHCARQLIIENLDPSYQNMSQLYFPQGRTLGDVTFRLLRYDGYPTRNRDGRLIVVNNEQIAKAHYDRGGLTIQAYASAPGFWAHPDPKDGSKRKPTTNDDKVYPPHGIGRSQLFAGAGHRTVYGSGDHIKPLYHGVDRIVDEEDLEKEFIPPRTAAIAFIDAPLVNLGITSKDTQPDRVDAHKFVV